MSEERQIQICEGLGRQRDVAELPYACLIRKGESEREASVDWNSRCVLCVCACVCIRVRGGGGTLFSRHLFMNYAKVRRSLNRVRGCHGESEGLGPDLV